MKKSQIEFLDLFFDEGEDISVSDGKFSYHSITRDDIESNDITLKMPPKPPKFPTERTHKITNDQIALVCINPVSGWKRDENVTKFRSFLVELDDLPLKQQKEYIEKSGMPYSICVYSGSKSLHYGIVLESPVPDYNAWKFIAKWIVNILEEADEQNVVPSKGIRFPDNTRPDGLKKKQALIEMRTRIDNDILWDWLIQHEDKKPVLKKTTEDEFAEEDSVKSIGIYDLPNSIIQQLTRLKNGTQDYRNKSWFSLSCFMAKKGVTMKETVRVFSEFFIEESDFDRNEWLTAIESGYNHIRKKD